MKDYKGSKESKSEESIVSKIVYFNTTLHYSTHL